MKKRNKVIKTKDIADYLSYLFIFIILIGIIAISYYFNSSFTPYSIKDTNLELTTFTADEEPEFNIELENSNQITGLAFLDLQNIDIFIINPDGQEIKLEKELKKTKQGYNIKLKKEKAFRAGLYKLRVKTKDYTEEQDFLWGVLAINVDKSI